MDAQDLPWSERMLLVRKAVDRVHDPEAADQGAVHTGLIRCPLCGDPLRWTVWHQGSLSVRCLGYSCVRFD